MNSYGSVGRVSESIYKVLRYMNWISSNDDDNNDMVSSVNCVSGRVSPPLAASVKGANDIIPATGPILCPQSYEPTK